MKPLYNIFFIALLLTGLASCKKDDSGFSASIVGRWNLSKVSIQAQTISKSAVTNSYSDTSITAHTYIQFNSDKTATEVLSSGFYGNNEFAGIFALGNPGNMAGPYNYRLAGTTLNLDYSGLVLALYITPSPFTEKVINLDARNLVLQREVVTGVNSIITTTYYNKAN